MKRFGAFLALILSASLSYSQVLVTDFNQSDISGTTGSFTITLGPLSTDITGTDANNAFFTLSTATPDLSGFLSSVNLTGTFNGGTATGAVQVQLFDAEGDSYIYEALWSNFTLGVLSTVNFVYVGSDSPEGGTFNNIVTGVAIVGTGGGLASINFTAHSLAAVPEPSVYAMLALGVGAVFLLRRRTA